MINQIDKKWWFKCNGFLRILYVKGYLHPFFNSYVVTEYPKSGGTWLSQLLSSSLDVPYPRNRLPMFESSVIHGCFLGSGKNNKTIVLNRDGRDIMVSFYYYSLIKKPLASKVESERIVADLGITDIEDIKRNLPFFIEYCFANKTYPRFTWSQFVNKWHDDTSVVHTSYEALHRDTAAELKIILHELGETNVSSDIINNVVDRFSFERQAKRKNGESDTSSFLRKGVVGDWKNSFSQDSRELFDYYAGNELILSGYEKDHSWV